MIIQERGKLFQEISILSYSGKISIGKQPMIFQLQLGPNALQLWCFHPSLKGVIWLQKPRLMNWGGTQAREKALMKQSVKLRHISKTSNSDSSLKGSWSRSGLFFLGLTLASSFQRRTSILGEVTSKGLQVRLSIGCLSFLSLTGRQSLILLEKRAGLFGEGLTPSEASDDAWHS